MTTTAEQDHFNRARAERRRQAAIDQYVAETHAAYIEAQDALYAQLSHAETVAIDQYVNTISVFKDINGALRSGVPLRADRPDLAGIVAALDHAVALSPTWTDLELHRGVKPTGRGAAFAAALTTGTVFTDPGFVSTSIAPDYVKADWAVHIRILIEPGTLAAPLRGGRDTAHEQEMLLGRNTVFRVVSSRMATIPDTFHPGQTVQQRQITLVIEPATPNPPPVVFDLDMGATIQPHGGGYVENPAWVTTHLANAWVTLENTVKPQWLPRLDRTRNQGKALVADIPEYGCGAYGCVMPTLDPQVVIKVTTDDTEAEFAGKLAGTLPVPICTIYHLVYLLPEAKRQGRKVYLLWREAADDVGQVDVVLGDQAEVAISAQHAAAQDAYELLQRGRPAEAALKTWTAAVTRLGKVPELAWLADGLLRTYRETGIFFGDIHGGNLGRARGQWVITDPGHVAVVQR